MSLDFLRKPNDTIRIGRNYDNPDEDAWDDRELIKAYDASIKGFRKTKKKLKEGYHPELTEAPVPGPWEPVNDATDYAYEDYGHGPSLFSAEVQAQEEINHEVAGGAENANEIHEAEMEDFEEYEEEDEEYEDGDDEVPTSSVQHPHRMQNSQAPNIFMPPMPSSSAHDFGRGTLPSLLNSWYMSGYHAGYFDAQQEFKKQALLKQRRKNDRK